MAGSPSVAVTGSSGVVGTALVESLLGQGYDARGVDKRPNPWSEEVDAVTKQLDLLETGLGEDFPRAELIVHLAAHSRVRPTVENPRYAIENLESTLAVIERARELDAGVVFASSREVYGDVRGAMAVEGEFGLDDPANPYAASKVGGEALLSAARSCYGLDACVLRLANVYGPYDASDRVVPLFIARALAGKDLTIYGEEKVLDFVYLDDCVRGILAAIESFNVAEDETFNVATGEGTSLQRLAITVSELVERDISIHVEDNRRGEVTRFIGDPSKAQRVLGFEPRYSLRSGLRETIEWYRAHESVTRGILDSGA